MQIYNSDKKYFYQWDINRLITSTNFKLGETIHFVNIQQSKALPLVTYELNGKVVVDVPNILLQTAYPITVYHYVQDNTGSFTKEECSFTVKNRPKPDDYVYTQTEVFNFNDLEKRITILETGGVGITIDQEYTPESENAQSGKAVAQALDDYVKDTDYAAQDTAGVVKVSQTYGTRMVNGVLDLMPAQNSEIDKRAPNEYPLYLVTDYTRHMIVPANLDYAVKKALADNKIADTSYAWTDEEKASARALLGIDALIGDIGTALDELHTYAQSLVNGGNA